MTPLHLFLTVAGAVSVTHQIIRFIVWLDTPHGKKKT